MRPFVCKNGTSSCQDTASQLLDDVTVRTSPFPTRSPYRMVTYTARSHGMNTEKFSSTAKKSNCLRNIARIFFRLIGNTGVISMRYQVPVINFIVTPCINNIQHFNYQLMHTTLKNVELRKHSKISKTAPTCFGLQENHHQGAIVST